MIQEALVFVKNALDQNLKNRFELLESITVLNYLIDQGGELPQINHNKVVISLLNLEHETAKQYSREGIRRDNAQQLQKVNPAVRFNLDLLFTASFDDYEESLKFLNAVIAYFQSNPLLTAQTNPMMPTDLQKLSFEVEKLSYVDTHNLWTAMGAKYQPSIIYKVRHITIQEEEVKTLESPISRISTLAEPGL